MTTLNLDKRPCKIGSSVNTRTEKHGDEDVPACDIPLAGVMIDRDEVHMLLGKGVHSYLFTTKKNSGMDFAELSDFAKKCSPFRLTDKFEESRVVLTLGIDGDEITLEGDVKLAKVKLEPQPGGLTAMSVTVQCAPDTDTMARVIAFMNCDVDAEIRFGKRATKKSDKQPELPMAATKATDSEGDRLTIDVH